jgi:hypothetical protein
VPDEFCNRLISVAPFVQTSLNCFLAAIRASLHCNSASVPFPRTHA